MCRPLNKPFAFPIPVSFVPSITYTIPMCHSFIPYRRSLFHEHYLIDKQRRQITSPFPLFLAIYPTCSFSCLHMICLLVPFPPLPPCPSGSGPFTRSLALRMLLARRVRGFYFIVDECWVPNSSFDVARLWRVSLPA